MIAVLLQQVEALIDLHNRQIGIMSRPATKAL
jgi:hypothetical protein